MTVRQAMEGHLSALAKVRADVGAFVVILAIGVFARTWQFPSVPLGINLDEASIGVDAYSLANYGIDRNGVSYPTHFIAFGQEQNTLYGYVLIPFIALLGLKVAVVRLPMLIAGILTMPLVYFIARRGFGPRIGMLSMFFVAVSPWHIMLSRYALDVNSFPFVFVLGYSCVLLAERYSRWFVPACGLLALCFYTYGPSYFIVPVMLVTILLTLYGRGRPKPTHVAAGLIVFVLIALPCLLFILVNLLGWDSIHIGSMTIPRLPSPARFLAETDKAPALWPAIMARNFGTLMSLLVGQSDGLIYNVYPPYGYFYRLTFPFAALGAYLLLRHRRLGNGISRPLLLMWVASSLVFGTLEFVNINRLNIIFIPLLILMAVALDWLGSKVHAAVPLAVSGLLIAFVSFTVDYHGPGYRALADSKFRPGLLPAIQFASSLGPGPICVTDEPDFPYIYVLFVEQLDPETYLPSIEYVSIPDPSRRVRSLLQYTFGKADCSPWPPPVYVLKVAEIPPRFGNRYAQEFFYDYVVYYPRAE